MEGDTSRRCVYCDQPIKLVDGAWVVMGSGTTGDGLSYCPPDPDREPVGAHYPMDPFIGWVVREGRHRR
jgi:hypothetical protein